MNKKLRYLTTYTALIALLLILSGVSIAAGSISIPAGDIFKVLAGGQADSTYAQIITGIRIPRVLAAIFLGGALSLSGYLLQTFFANPIAGPFVLGISQGAKLAVALTLILTLRHGFTPGSPPHAENVPSGHLRHHDRLYLFSCHRLCHHLCKRL